MTWNNFPSILKLIKFNLAFSILFTVLPGFFVGSSLPSLELALYTLLGTLLVSCSAFVYNQIIEVKRDALMKRTQSRPLVTQEISLRFAHILGSTLLGVGTIILFFGSMPLAACIALGSFTYYVFIYTAFLKTRTSLNTLLGGISGSVGPLIGEAAVSASISEYGLSMFLLLFLWQPAHFWCLALHYQEDYRRANIPMLPVVKGFHHTTKQMIGYQVLLCLVFVLMSIPPLHLTSYIFLFPSLSLGLIVLYFMWRLALVAVVSNDSSPKKLKGFSNSFLRGTCAKPLQSSFIRNKKQMDTKGEFLLQRKILRPMQIFFLTILHMVVWHLALGLDFYLRFWN